MPVLDTEILLPRPRDEVFAFFADARNLEAITPPWLKFRVLTPAPIDMAAGTLIDYRLRVRWVPVRWTTEITIWEPPYRFVDTQRKGPYRKWVHLHTFDEVEGGTLCRDRVEYEAPGGEVVHRFFVRRDVERIFAFRQEKLLERFSGGKGV